MDRHPTTLPAGTHPRLGGRRRFLIPLLHTPKDHRAKGLTAPNNRQGWSYEPENGAGEKQQCGQRWL